MQGIDPANCTIYIGTFSKVLFPALRLGYLVVPPNLVDTFIAAHNFISFYLPVLEQAVLADFISERHFIRHIRRMRKLYGDRRANLVTALERELGFEVYASETGMHLVLWLPPGMDDRLASQQAAAHGVDVLPLSLFCLESPDRGGLLLGYAATNEREIEDGVRRLGIALRSI
ncbi:MAG: aminotransferase class I/II-fold pyridoxal phosphate-dependent enzyme [Xenococcaceae cyanobacterium]